MKMQWGHSRLSEMAKILVHYHEPDGVVEIISIEAKMLVSYFLQKSSPHWYLFPACYYTCFRGETNG
jgi:hypothetical protein